MSRTDLRIAEVSEAIGVPTDHVFAAVEHRGRTNVFYSPSIEGEVEVWRVLLRRDGDGVLRRDGDEVKIPDAYEVLLDPEQLRRYLA